MEDFRENKGHDFGDDFVTTFFGFSFLSSKFFVCGATKKCVPSSVETDGRFPTAEQCGAVQKAAAEVGIVQQKASPLFDRGELGVSKNRGTPKWMVYNGKPY